MLFIHHFIMHTITYIFQKTTYQKQFISCLFSIVKSVKLFIHQFNIHAYVKNNLENELISMTSNAI